MQNAQGIGDNGYLARFLRDSVASCIVLIQAITSNEERLDFERFVHSCLDGRFMHEVFGAACGSYIFEENDAYQSDYLRDSIAASVSSIAKTKQEFSSHEERVNYETWVRFCLACKFMPDVLAVACGIFSFDEKVVNQKMEKLIKDALATIPNDAEFIRDMMSQLPDSEPMKALAANLYPTDDLVSVAIGRFRDSLNWTMEIDQPDD